MVLCGTFYCDAFSSLILLQAVVNQVSAFAIDSPLRVMMTIAKPPTYSSVTRTTESARLASTSSFKQTKSCEIKHGIQYNADAPENDLSPFLRGNTILDTFAYTAKMDKLSVNDVIESIFIASKSQFTLEMKSAEIKQRQLLNAPRMMISGREFKASAEAIDLYKYKPHSVRVTIYGAPPTMKDEVLTRFISKHADIVGVVERAYVSEPYQKVIDYSARFVTVTNLKSAAGLPIVGWFSENRVRFTHRGQIRDRNERNKVLHDEWEQRELSRISKHPDHISKQKSYGLRDDEIQRAHESPSDLMDSTITAPDEVRINSIHNDTCQKINEIIDTAKSNLDNCQNTTKSAIPNPRRKATPVQRINLAPRNTHTALDTGESDSDVDVMDKVNVNSVSSDCTKLVAHSDEDVDNDAFESDSPLPILDYNDKEPLSTGTGFIDEVISPTPPYDEEAIIYDNTQLTGEISYPTKETIIGITDTTPSGQSTSDHTKDGTYSTISDNTDASGSERNSCKSIQNEDLNETLTPGQKQPSAPPDDSGPGTLTQILNDADHIQSGDNPLTLNILTTTSLETPIPNQKVQTTRIFRSRSTSLKRKNNGADNGGPAIHKKADTKTTPPGICNARLDTTKTSQCKATRPAKK